MNLVTKIYPYVTTSLDMSEISSYAQAILSADDLQFQDFRVPTDEFGLGGYLDGSWYLFPNTLVDNARVLHQFLYGDDSEFTASAQLQAISDKIQTYADSSTDQSTGGSANDVTSDTSTDYSSSYSSDYSSDYSSSYSSSDYSYSYDSTDYSSDSSYDSSGPAEDTSSSADSGASSDSTASSDSAATDSGSSESAQ